ncbi:unnamed protein product [Merluccius merluccius]
MVNRPERRRLSGLTGRTPRSYASCSTRVSFKAREHDVKSMNDVPPSDFNAKCSQSKRTLFYPAEAVSNMDA